jgi:hypothetical protein
MALAVLPPEERLQKPRVFGGKDEAAKLSNTVRGLLRCLRVEIKCIHAQMRRCNFVCCTKIRGVIHVLVAGSLLWRREGFPKWIFWEGISNTNEIRI